MAHYDPLVQVLRQEIAAHGPVSVAQFMNLVLGHADHGYYMRQDPFGQGGDFTTAPEISQIFGELVAGWLIDTWYKLGTPAKVILLECGPGRGTLMADVLRVAQGVPDFIAAIQPTLLEISPTLKARQQQTLSPYTQHCAAPQWIGSIEKLPSDMPLLVVANEFLDALPVHHVVKRGDELRERKIREDAERFVWEEGDCDVPVDQAALDIAQDGEVIEISPQRSAFINALTSKMDGQSAALFIDYGYRDHAAGETLQALRRHKFCDVLDHIGEADLTAHVDFGAVMRAAQQAPDMHAYFETQGEFLNHLGGVHRAQMLVNAARTPEQKKDIVTGYHRLTHDSQMGTLFKVCALVRGEVPLAGF